MTEVHNVQIDNQTNNQTNYDNDTESDFGESPYVGGDIKLKNNYFLYVGIAILVFVVILLIISIVKKVPVNGENYYQRELHRHFNNIHGEEFDDEAKQVIEIGRQIPNTRAIDHFRLGTVYLINMRNPNLAHEQFTRALDRIAEGKDMNDANFIIDRVRDLQDLFVDTDLGDLPLQQAIINTFSYQIKKTPKKEINTEDPDYVQKSLINQQEWQSDSQNVHDTAIYNELMEQVSQVMEENKSIPNISTKDYQDAVTWLKVRYANEPTKLEKINRVISFLNHNYPIGNMPGFNEQDILVTVWQRTFDPENKLNVTAMRESIGDAVLDCYEGTNVVCMTGRTSKIWQALARLDKNPEIGILRSKQLLRNEIYERAAKIVDDFVGERGTASEMLKNAYQNNENTEQVRELVEYMKQQIDELKNDYTGLLPEDQLNMIIKQCKDTISLD